MNFMQKLDHFDYCKSLKNMLESQQATGRTGKKFDQLLALSTQTNLVALRDLMLKFKPKRTLEIGLSFGGSCLVLAASHRDIHQPSKQHVAIDPFQKTIWDDVARLALEEEQLSDYVEIYEGFSFTVLPQLISKEQNFDLIYVDGSHLFENVFIDFFYSNQLLNQEGILIFDDSRDPHIRKVLNFIDSNFKSTYKKLDLSYLRSGLDKYRLHLATAVGKNQLTAYRKVGDTDRSWNSQFYNF
jgi:predicted O-methyltransferase YrrM